MIALHQAPGLASKSPRESDGRPKDARASFRARIMGAVERMSSAMTDEMLHAALAAPSDLGTLARAVGDSRLIDPASAIDPYASAIARSLGHRETLARMAGPMLSSTQAAQMLGISRQAIDKRRMASKLLAVRIGSDWHYPAFQFEGSATLPGLGDVLAAEPSSDGWSRLDLLLAPDTALGGRSLLDVLRAQDDEAVQRSVRQMRADGFA